MNPLRGTLILLYFSSCCVPSGLAQSARPPQVSNFKTEKALLEKKPIAGIISHVKGTIFLNGKPHVFRQWDKIHSGWILACKSGSELVIVFNDNSRETLRPNQKPFPVPYIPAGSGPLDSVQVPAGREQSPGVSIFSPPQKEGQVWLSQFRFRWIPLTKGTQLNLILRRWPLRLDEDKPLWAQSVTEEGSGEMDSSEARDILQGLAEREPMTKLEFTLAPMDGRGQSVVFSVLSKQDEERFVKELKTWDKVEEPLRFIARASIMQHYRLYSEAAAEMEQAVKIDGGSVNLRIGAVWAQRRSGNLERANYHIQHLPPGTKIPGN